MKRLALVLVCLAFPLGTPAEEIGFVVPSFNESEDATMRDAVLFPGITKWRYHLTPDFPYEVLPVNDDWAHLQRGRLYTDGVATYLYVYPGSNGCIDATTDTIKLMLTPEFLGKDRYPDSLGDDDYTRFDLCQMITLGTEYGVSRSRKGGTETRESFARGDQLHALLLRLATDFHGTHIVSNTQRTEILGRTRAIEAALNAAWGGNGVRLHFDLFLLPAERRYVITIATVAVPDFLSEADARSKLNDMVASGKLVAAGIFPADRAGWRLPDGEFIALDRYIPALNKSWVRVTDECE